MKEPRFPKAQPKGVCRGCLGVVPKNRKTWCSRACAKLYDPFFVKQAVWNRDGGLCQMCGLPAPRQRDWRYDASLSWDENRSRRRALKEHRAEFDHIIPHCEGGKFVLENIRLLGRSCHLERTREWRRQRKAVTA